MLLLVVRVMVLQASIKKFGDFVGRLRLEDEARAIPGHAARAGAVIYTLLLLSVYRS
jgi:hypothetical protein